MRADNAMMMMMMIEILKIMIIGHELVMIVDGCDKSRVNFVVKMLKSLRSSLFAFSR